MNEKRLTEIEAMAESMEVSARDENIILDLIQALRDERQKSNTYRNALEQIERANVNDGYMVAIVKETLKCVKK